MKKAIKKVTKVISYIFIILIIIIAATIIIRDLATEASNSRDWKLDQVILPYAEVNGDIVTLHNVRNFTYKTTDDYTPAYYDKKFDLSKIKKIWYVVEPFSGIPGSAHTFLSFEFEDDNFVSVSVEIRKEKGESYHPIKGLFNKYEIMYVVADEKDAIKLRSNYRKDLVYLYPMIGTYETNKNIFLDMISRVNELKDKPEFYNTITNTCTTNIVEHINKINPGSISWLNRGIMFPAESDRLAFELGLISTDITNFDFVREKYFINKKAEAFADSPDFSRKIRE